MYEFVKTATGWRVFWGIDPLTVEPETACESAGDEGRDEPILLPFPRRDKTPAHRPAA